MKIIFLSHQKDKKQDDSYKKIEFHKTNAKPVLVSSIGRQQPNHVLKRLKRAIYNAQVSSQTMEIP